MSLSSAKKGTIVLCDKVLIGSVPEYELYSTDSMIELLNYWLDQKNEDNSVFVCLQINGSYNYRDENDCILVTHRKREVSMFANSYLDDLNIDEINLSVFEFHSYKEAFEYCIDLKEGF